MAFERSVVIFLACWILILAGPARASKRINVVVTPDDFLGDVKPSFLDSLRLQPVAAKLKQINDTERERLEAAIKSEFDARDAVSAGEARKREHYLALARCVPSNVALKLEFITSQLSSAGNRVLLGYAACEGRRWILLIDKDTEKPNGKIDITAFTTDEAMDILLAYAERKCTTCIELQHVLATPDVEPKEMLEAVKKSRRVAQAIGGKAFSTDPAYDSLCLALLAKTHLP